MSNPSVILLGSVFLSVRVIQGVVEQSRAVQGGWPRQLLIARDTVCGNGVGGWGTRGYGAPLDPASMAHTGKIVFQEHCQSWASHLMKFVPL